MTRSILVGMLPSPKINQTRDALLKAAFNEIQKSGFQAASLSRILADTGLTKGALYHYFKGKSSLGYAVIEEMIGSEMESTWLIPLTQNENPLDQLIEIIQRRMELIHQQCWFAGCPLHDLSQEMAGKDDGFRIRLQAVYQKWHQGLAYAIKKGQDNGYVLMDLSADDLASFIIATTEGCVAMAKNIQNKDALDKCSTELIRYLNKLRQS